MRIGAVSPPTSLFLTAVLLSTLGACAHSSQEPEPVQLKLAVELELDTRAEDLLPLVWKQIQESKIFSAEAYLRAFLKNNPNHLEASTLLAYLLEEEEDELEAQAAWADVEALLVYSGKLHPFLLQAPLFAGARRYLRLNKPNRARLFHDELWRRDPISVWSQRTHLEMAESAASRGRWVRVARVCQDMLRLGAEKKTSDRCKYLLQISASMLHMGPEPSPGAPRWSWLHPKPQGNTLHDAWSGKGGELFVVGEHGTILHRPAGSSEFLLNNSGTRWKLRGIHGDARDSLYAVGDAGIVLGFDGKTWKVERAADPIQGNLSAVFSGGKGHLVAVSLKGEVITLDGGKWTVDKPSSQPLYGVWGKSREELHAVGKGGFMLRYKDGAWNPVTSDSYEDLWGIWGNGDDHFVAVGSNRTVVHFNDGKGKEAVAGLTGFRDVWGIKGGQAWAVGIRGNIIHRAKKGGAWRNQPTGVKVDLLGVAGNTAREMVAVGQGGTLVERTKRGKWALTAGGSREKLVAVAPDLGSGPNGIVALGETGTLLLHGEKGWKVFKLLPRGRYRDLCSANGKFAAVGDRGLFMIFKNKKWIRIKTGTSEDLLDVAGCDQDTLVAVGTRGSVVRVGKGKVHRDRTPTSHPLYGVWSGSPRNIWAVGGRGVILHFDGKRWRELDTGHLQNLRAVAMAGKQLMAVGQGGLVLNLEGDRWKPFKSPTAQTLVALWGGPRGRLVAASQEGGIVHHDGEKWVIHHSSAPCLTSLSGHPKYGLLAVGCNRSVLTLSLDKLN